MPDRLDPGGRPIDLGHGILDEADPPQGDRPIDAGEVGADVVAELLVLLGGVSQLVQGVGEAAQDGVEVAAIVQGNCRRQILVGAAGECLGFLELPLAASYRPRCTSSRPKSARNRASAGTSPTAENSSSAR